MRLSTNKRSIDIQLNMTPMIDIVFQLLLFFMVCTEIARQDEFEDVLLPDVKASTPDENPDPLRLVINIKRDGSFWFGGGQRTEKDVLDALKIEARLSRDDVGISNRLVLVKADQRVEFQHIRKLIMMCVDRDVRIWRLAFGTEALGAGAPAEPGDTESP